MPRKGHGCRKIPPGGGLCVLRKQTHDLLINQIKLEHMILTDYIIIAFVGYFALREISNRFDRIENKINTLYQKLTDDDNDY